MSGVGVGVGGLASAAGLGHLTPAQLAAVSQANFVSPTLQVSLSLFFTGLIAYCLVSETFSYSIRIQIIKALLPLLYFS